MALVAVAQKGTDIHKWKSATTSESPPPDMGADTAGSRCGACSRGQHNHIHTISYVNHENEGVNEIF